ncbi:PIN domain-like protein [Cyathus striatus]|nr:PIN domain-like protein [Cyathus striatus]
MGISGLLPALKPIQIVKPLSDFKGKKVAVDAYVWLHKGVYACATELATGKATLKYVDYAMHRVRLLRHYGIEPYVVFDGGPLPAKRGTEDERKQKRDEYISRGHALAAQGKHSQARDCYVKCVDVTPQMAYQLIKALKAESVSYVVAPYEADAQLAYLERVGLVDAILTEDSDLLVFGCKNVLFKLDTAASTVVSISRSDFASICDANVSGMSFLGWSDVQFRAMAILSGCDYLPSIPGIGLKRACSLLRKWKTVEQAIRAILLDGKLKVPTGYLEKFRLAEKCYMHQRVYSPLEERLVHLTEVDVGWDQESDAYVGGDLDPMLARAIAVGDVDPVTLLPMIDINPGFKPNALKPIPSLVNSSPRRGKGKGKATERSVVGGILNFFGW